MARHPINVSNNDSVVPVNAYLKLSHYSNAQCLGSIFHTVFFTQADAVRKSDHTIIQILGLLFRVARPLL